jgi:hypothetical protein
VVYQVCTRFHSDRDWFRVLVLITRVRAGGDSAAAARRVP